LLQM
jgi:Zn-finger nucleic acid-binding protein